MGCCGCWNSDPVSWECSAVWCSLFLCLVCIFVHTHCKKHNEFRIKHAHTHTHAHAHACMHACTCTERERKRGRKREKWDGKLQALNHEICQHSKCLSPYSCFPLASFMLLVVPGQWCHVEFYLKALLWGVWQCLWWLSLMLSIIIITTCSGVC